MEHVRYHPPTQQMTNTERKESSSKQVSFPTPPPATTSTNKHEGVVDSNTLTLSVAKAKSAHFWNLAFPAVRLIVLAFLFTFFGIIQSARAYTVIGSLFGAFIFSVAGVSFWVGCHGISEAYASVRENFPDSATKSPTVNGKKIEQGILATISTYRIVDDSYVEYKIDVCVSGKEWSVWRRYSDFHRTFCQESVFATTIATVQLPPKRWFGSHLSSAFVAERMEALNEYLKRLLEEHGERRVDHAFAEFFGM